MCAVAVVTVVSTAWAQQPVYEDPKGNIGVHLGYTKTRDANDGNFLGGAQLELMLARWLGVQGMAAYRSEERFDVQAGATQAELNVRTVPLMLSGKFYIPVSPQLQPYGLAGGGWHFVMFDYSPELEALGLQDRDTSTFGWHLGAGAQARVSSSVALFAEGRWIFVDPDQALGDSTFEQIEDFDFDTSMFVAGMNFLF
jgi:opacity protein-like surface antigen